MSLFTRLSQLASSEGSRLTLEITGAGNGQIKVRVTPDLGPTPSNATDEEVTLRALMATPITILGTPEEADTLLTEQLEKRTPIQASGASALNDLAAKMAAATQKAQAVKPSAKTAATEPAATAKAEASEAKPKAPAETAEPVKAPTLDDGF